MVCVCLIKKYPREARPPKKQRPTYSAPHWWPEHEEIQLRKPNPGLCDGNPCSVILDSRMINPWFSKSTARGYFSKIHFTEVSLIYH